MTTTTITAPTITAAAGRETVACPECHRRATVLGRFTPADGDRSVEYVRLRCDGPLAFLAAAKDLRDWSGSWDRAA